MLLKAPLLTHWFIVCRFWHHVWSEHPGVCISFSTKEHDFLDFPQFYIFVHLKTIQFFEKLVIYLRRSPNKLSVDININFFGVFHLAIFMYGVATLDTWSNAAPLVLGTVPAVFFHSDYTPLGIFPADLFPARCFLLMFFRHLHFRCIFLNKVIKETKSNRTKPNQNLNLP